MSPSSSRIMPMAVTFVCDILPHLKARYRPAGIKPASGQCLRRPNQTTLRRRSAHRLSAMRSRNCNQKCEAPACMTGPSRKPGGGWQAKTARAKAAAGRPARPARQQPRTAAVRKPVGRSIMHPGDVLCSGVQAPAHWHHAHNASGALPNPNQSHFSATGRHYSVYVSSSRPRAFIRRSEKSL